MSSENLGSAQLTTTNAVTQTIYSCAVPPNSTVDMAGTIVARSTVGDAASWFARSLVKRVGTGNAVLVQTAAATKLADTGASAWTVAIAVSGTSVIINVTGAAGVTISWFRDGRTTVLN